jgi:hypothetical protein
VLSDVEPFGLALLVAAGVVSLALMSNRITGRVANPGPGDLPGGGGHRVGPDSG